MYRHLNLKSSWPNFRLNGLANENGVLYLATRPAPLKVGERLRAGISFDSIGLSGPASISIDSAGNVYIPDPDHHQIMRWRACDGVIDRPNCLGGEGTLPGQFKSPHGVLVGPRGGLYVADTGNQRIQIFDLETLQLRSIWGAADALGNPVSGEELSEFRQPWDLCADSDSFIYVTDRGNRRVQKFDADGHPIRAFWDQLRHERIVPRDPQYAATILIDGHERLLIADSPSRFLVYKLDGSFDEENSKRWSALSENLPGGVIFISERDCAAGAEARQALAFDAEGKFLGSVQDDSKASARLVLDQRSRLLVQTRVVHGGLVPGQVYRSSADFLAGPFSSNKLPTRWQRVKAAVQGLSQNAHIQFFTFTSEHTFVPPWPPPELANSAVPVPTDIWRAAPMDAVDFLVIHQPATFLWIGGVMQGDEKSSPALSQIRLDYDHEGWIRYLPAIYRRNDVPDTRLERSLAVFESLLAGVQSEIDDLPRLFDAWATPDQTPNSWLDWLSTWVAFELDENWESIKRRKALANAFNLLGKRGTVRGLKDFISLYVGENAVIDEPAAHASLWLLSEDVVSGDLANPDERQDETTGAGSCLGFNTMLLAGQPDGAILDSTAFIDESALIDASDYGAPLFEDLAHRFCVHVPAADVASPESMESLRRIIDQEKPAHTTYQICITKPLMRVGAQARLGVDAIVGGPLPELVLDAQLGLGVETAIAAPFGPGKTISANSRVGIGTRLV